MAWQESYYIDGGSKNGWSYRLKVYEDQVDPIILKTLKSVGSFRLKFLQKDDNVFDPILASNLIVSVLNDGTVELPNFVADDDRKYFVKLEASKTGQPTWTLFRGWILNDGANAPFTTGVQILQFTCVDGLAMLQDITYEPLDEDINSLSNLKDVAIQCLNQIEYPDGLGFNSCVSTFADGMSDRTDGLVNEPLAQSYTYQYTWTDDNGAYLSCYEVLRRIAVSFNCKLFQSVGDWQFVQVNELGSNTLYLTQYDETGAAINSANANIRMVIKPYPNDLHFINNDQMKYLQKGYNLLTVTQNAKYPANAVDNGDLKRITGSFPTNFTKQTTGSGSEVVYNSEKALFYMFRVNSTADPSNLVGWAGVRCDSVAEVAMGSTIEFSCDFIGPAVASTGNTLIVELIVQQKGFSVFRWLKAGTDSPVWADTSNLYYYTKGWGSESSTVTIKTPPVPFDSIVTLRVANGFQALGSDAVYVSNIKLKYTPQRDKVSLALAKNNTNGKYKFESENYLGWDQLDPTSIWSSTPNNTATTSSGTSHTMRVNAGTGSVFVLSNTNMRYIGTPITAKFVANLLFRWNSAASATLHLLKNGTSVGTAFVGSGGPTGFKNITLTVEDLQLNTADILILQLQWIGTQSYTIDTISGTITLSDYGLPFNGLKGLLMDADGTPWTNWGRKNAAGTLRFLEVFSRNLYDVLNLARVYVECSLANAFAAKNGETSPYPFNPTVSFIAQDGQSFINVNTKPLIFTQGEVSYGSDEATATISETTATQFSDFTETYTIS
jgi:hypothetical protein